jgi:protein SCO1
MRRPLLRIPIAMTAAILMLLASASAQGAEHDARGVLLKKDAAHHKVVISCDSIPGYMDAMEMEFQVEDAGTLTKMKPGDLLHFTIVKHGKDLVATRIRPLTNFEAEPAEAGALTALGNTGGTSTERQVKAGDPVPDFALTDQDGKLVRLSDFKGKVVALTFGYSRCPNPNYCLRLSRNLTQVERRFHDRAGRELVLMTIAIDPEYDRGETLRRYARSLGADAQSWHFLTGSVPEVRNIAALFGMNFWQSEGLLMHTMHTVVIDRAGALAANVEGNAFTPKQLGDLVETVLKSGAMDRSGSAPAPR